jgi:AcrR family transcriptional regulator
VEAATTLIEETGGLNMTDLGARLGVDPTAVYRYFKSRADLLSAVAHHFTLPLHEPVPETGDWRRDFEDLVGRFESLYRAHPALAAVVTSLTEVTGPILGVLGHGVDLLRRSGGSDRDVFVAMHAVEIAAFGAIMYDTVGAPDDETVRRDYHRAIGRLDVDELYPTRDALERESSDTMWMLVRAALDRLEDSAREP